MRNRTRLALLGASAAMLLSARYISPSTAAVEAPAFEAAPAIPLTITLAPPPLDMRRGEAALGMVAALLEEELSHIAGVVPRIDDAAPSPAFQDALMPADGSAAWHGRLELVGDGSLAEGRLEVCDPSGQCEVLSLFSSWHSVEPEVPRAVAAIAERMGRPVLGDHHVTAMSQDEYAELMTGRASAIVYDLRAPVDEQYVGNRRIDPLHRAPYLDPGMELAWWQQGRQRSGDARIDALGRAAELAPSCPLHRANYAWALGRAEDCGEAWSLWAALVADIPETGADPRFLLPRAEAAICAGALDAGEALLARAGRPEHPTVARLQVALSAAHGELPDHDARLARWQAAAPNLSEPVMARIQLRLRDDRLEEAEALLDELARRGAVRAAEALRLSLAAEAHDWQQALRSAEALDRTAAARLRGRLAMEGIAHERIVATAGDPLLSIAAARQALGAGRAADALARVDAVLAESPHMTEALAAREEILRAAGRHEDADETHARLVWLDPRRAEQR